MPCIVKVRISGIRDINAFEKSEIDSVRYVEIDDVENINSGYIQIDFSFFYFHDNLKLEGWFPLYDSLAGLRGELYCTIKWEFFEEKNPYNDNCADVLLLGTTSFPKNSLYYIEQIIDFAHELKIVNDPEYDWKDLIRSNRNSNEARCDVIQNSFMQARKTIGKKAKLLGGNAILGYQEHLNLEGGTTNKICVRIIGTVVKLRIKNVNDLGYVNIYENNNIKYILRNHETALQNNVDRYKDMKFSMRDSTHPNSTSYNFVDVILLTVDSLPNNIKYTYGGLVAAKAVKVLHQRLTEQHRDEWFLEIRDELKSNAKFLSCNVILGYKEDSYIFNDVIVLFCYGTAINVLPSYFLDDKIISFSHGDKCKAPPQRGNSINANKNASCIYLHYASEEIENSKVICRVCNEASVPKIFISSGNVPQNLAIIGNGFLISAFVVYPLKKHHGEYLASEISEVLPFLELNLHKQIICKLLVNGFNSIYDYNLKLCFNHNFLFGYCYGTGMCIYGIYSENKFLIKSNYKDNFNIRNKSISARELKIIYDNINYRSFFSKNKSLISPVFVRGEIVNNSNRCELIETYKSKLICGNGKGRTHKSLCEEKESLLFCYGGEHNECKKNGHDEDAIDNHGISKVRSGNYFRLKEIYLREEENLLNEGHDSDNVKYENFCREKENDNVDEIPKLGIKERKRIKKKKEKRKAKKKKNKGYIYEVEDHLDNITLLNIYEDSIALYNYIFNLDVKNYLLNKRYDIGLTAKPNEFCKQFQERVIKKDGDKRQHFKGNIQANVENISTETAKREKVPSETVLPKQDIIPNGCKQGNEKKRDITTDSHNWEKQMTFERNAIHRGEKKVGNNEGGRNVDAKCDSFRYANRLNGYLYPTKPNKESSTISKVRDKLTRMHSHSFGYDRGESSLTLDYEFGRGLFEKNDKYFFYICTLDFLPSIRFETFYEHKGDKNEGENNNNVFSNSEYMSDGKVARAHKAAAPKKMSLPSDSYFGDGLPNENRISLHEGNSDTGERREEPPTDRSAYRVKRREINEEEKRKKKKEKKIKNKSKHTYLNNLSRSYIYLIKRINMFCENSDQVDVVYEQINKAFNDLFNIFIFYIIVHNLSPCCICSIKLHFSFISFDILEIMLTGHLIKVKNNDSVKLEITNMDTTMQENLLKHFFNHLENYYMERSEWFFTCTNIFPFQRDDSKNNFTKRQSTKKDQSQFGFISTRRNSVNRKNNNFFSLFPTFLKSSFSFLTDKIRNSFNIGKKKNKENRNNLFGKDVITQDREKKATKINKLTMLLKKGDKKVCPSSELYNMRDSYFLFRELKNYITLENRKHLYDTSFEQKFSSIIITPLNVLPNVIIKKYFGVISLHIVKENINLKKFDFFYQSLISDILFIAKSHIKAIGANLISSFKITNLYLREEKSHGYALISVCGDVAKI
ncbi:conserved Plasmodium protein, unknown function [Plasmodium ovale wallikeri]|uniref:Uncharacterized protein n=1 Tax=Plasmodium ovale wallikeri TaxID=864142 RepID=A0A1A8YJQ8_PLAOA|nr:conserved Plasmodium protein, unknown function [Plasmodium ovale wallikeri]SBT32288.1 conserved Plasmodium protein, unknown function [Plasmodium ovale wallikeri]